MKTKKFLNISEFAELCGESRQTLIYYDRIGLFSPSEVGENGYRRYTHGQIGPITVISTLKELGVPLAEIKRIVKEVSPKRAAGIFGRQLGAAEERIARLVRLSGMMRIRLEQIRRGMEAGGGVRIEERDERRYYYGKELCKPYSELTDEDWVEFYDGCERKGIPYGYSAGFLVSRESGDVLRMCFRAGDDVPEAETVPAGTWAVAYARGDYGGTGADRRRLLASIGEMGYCPTGDVYEEYLFDEVTSSSPDDYLAELSVPVRRA